MNVRCRILFSSLLLFNCCCVFAQRSNPVHDSINKSFHERITLGGGLDGKNSFISNRKAQIWGIKAAAEFGNLIQLGIGYYRLNDDIERKIFFTAEGGIRDSAMAEIRMDYVSWYARYVFYRKGKWKFSIIPFQLGVGRSRYLQRVNEVKVFHAQRSIIVYETGFSVGYRATKWLGVGADAGVRWMVKDNPNIADKFNSPTYSFYVIIYWTEILRTIAPENKFVKML
jgi:hypothetical protein